MAEMHINPTRMELKKLQARYVTARRGHKLLKDKRDELMRRFLDIVRRDREVRKRVDAGLAEVFGSFSAAMAEGNPRMIKESLILPRATSLVAVQTHDQMGVTLPEFAFSHTAAGEGLQYGFAFTSGELDRSISLLEQLRGDLLTLAELDKQTLLLAREIERTRRRVNALEHILIPQYLATIRRIKMKLDENERGNITRLMKVKDMMLAAAHAPTDTDEED